MRRDMHRLLVGRPRCGPRVRIKRRKLHQRARRDPEGSARRESMSRGRGTKVLNENLAPLVRFLRSRLGRHWDSVYSELCEGLRPDSTVQKHVLDHLWDFVAVRTGVVEGAVYAHSRSNTFVRLADTRFSPRFYVCPKTGCLRDVRVLREKARRSKRKAR